MGKSIANATARGCRDILPSVASARRMLIERFAGMADTYGFSEVETPILERGTVFKRALGATSDIISSELYHVVSTEPDGLVLRPEGTAPVLRALSRHKAGFTGGVLSGLYGARLWYVGKMFRHERPQRLRYREFTQLGCEIVGDDSVSADVDAITLAHTFLNSTDTKATLQINTLGSIEDRQRYNATLKDYLKVSPRYEALSEMSRLRVDRGECMRILDSKLSEDIDIMKSAPTLEEYIGHKEKRRFEQICQHLQDEGVAYTLNKKLVRGLDYYTSTAFEFVHNKRALAGGGRYSGLYNLSGVGFAIGLDRIEPHNDVVESLWNQLADGIVVVPIEAQHAAIAKKLTRELRGAGMRALTRLDGAKLRKQISRAVKANALGIIMIGSDDLKKGMVRMKIIEKERGTGDYEQADVRVEEVTQFCSALYEDKRNRPRR